ncbi:MAG: UDP-N-acetylmuramate dehydrogenase [Phycisphaerales bacterium]|nr:UDP-N-acetylmuramate dehydrogenase [Phycisphaerales bacterium]
MSWWRPWADRIEPDAPIGAMTWYRIGGRARWLAHPRDAEDLAALCRRVRQEGLTLRVLGRGANVLVRDEGFDGVVVRLDAPSFTRVTFDGARVLAGGGADLMRLCRTCAERGLSGIEGLAAIPASIGGAVRMNAGGRFGQLGDVVRCATLLTVEGALREVEKAGIGFGYRTWGWDRAMVLSAELELAVDDPLRVRGRFKEYWRMKRATQPVGERSAGCVFKNPPQESSGRLIDSAGLKGATSGGAQVSLRHANFIVAAEDALAADVLRLADHVRRTVRDRFGTELELEMEVW